MFLKKKRVINHSSEGNMSDKNYDSNDSSIDDEWLTLKALQSYLHLSRTSFYRLIKSDESFPKGYNILSNKKLWKKKEVQDWVKSKSELSES